LTIKTSWKFDAEIFTNNNPYLSLLAAQAERVETVYFEFDKYDLDDNNKKNLRFYDKVDTSSIESIQIYGYVMTAEPDYNYKLSEQRVLTIQSLLTSIGFNKNKILIIEGKALY
jgi:outer membrane protein OmpA-like peptidoglycan-associated protein